jgi:hypothetical protein
LLGFVEQQIKQVCSVEGLSGFVVVVIEGEVRASWMILDGVLNGEMTTRFECGDDEVV